MFPFGKIVCLFSLYGISIHPLVVLFSLRSFDLLRSIFKKVRFCWMFRWRYVDDDGDDSDDEKGKCTLKIASNLMWMLFSIILGWIPISEFIVCSFLLRLNFKFITFFSFCENKRTTIELCRDKLCWHWLHGLPKLKNSLPMCA